MKTKIISLILLSTITISCRKVLNIEVPEKDKKIVINAIFLPDSNAKIFISKSIGVLENLNNDTFINFDKFLLPDAEVSLFEDNNFKEKLTFNTNSFFTEGSTTLQTNKKYKIVASHKNYTDQASFNFEIPQLVPIQSVNSIYETEQYTQPIYDQNGQYIKDSIFQNIKYLEFKINFKDPENIDNYYLLSIEYQSPITTYNPQTNELDTVDYYYYSVGYRIIGIETDPHNDDGIISNNSFYLPRVNLLYNIYGAVFNDSWFQKGNYTLTARLDFGYVDYKNSTIKSNILKKEKYRITLYSATKDLLYYASSLDLYYKTNGDPFSEPVNVYSNVNGGYGFICALNPSIKEIEIEYK